LQKIRELVTISGYTFAWL